MGRRAIVLAMLSACSFALPPTPGTDDDVGGDGSGTSPPPGCTPGFLDLCAQPAPTEPLDITGADTLNTDSDPRCRTLAQAGGRDVCLVYATGVTIAAGSSLTVTGSRPLVLAATTTLAIGGTLDVASSRVEGRTGPAASDDTCAFARAPETDLGGAAGAAGGAFGGDGGDGGTGDVGSSLGGDGEALPGLHGAPTTATAILRGGCRGGDGANQSADGGVGGRGGAGGGAVYLYAPQRLEIGGTVRATGAGGNGGQQQAGGGGGGSGGLVVIESADIQIAGTISANGGGAGEGGVHYVSNPPGDVTGAPGEDGGLVAPALGGNQGTLAGGHGGTGATGSAAATTGDSSDVGGGGGGGSVGIVMLLGARTISGNVSPAPR
jgi:hypothetical protein